MTTLKDLSRHLGLSVTQVSRALNGHSDVSAKTRARVEEAVKDLKYIPNMTARRLVSGRSGVVGLVAEGGPDTPEDSVFFETVLGLGREFSARDTQFVLHLTDGDMDTDPGITDVYDRLIHGGGLDGFVLLRPRPDDLRIKHLSEAGIAFVVHGRMGGYATHPYFDIDNAAIFRRHVEHLAGLGHRRIALIDAAEGFSFTEFREAGYREGLAANGLPFDPALLVRGEMTEGNGLVGAIRLMSEARPTAIICGNVLVAKGLFSALDALGLRVPKDVSVAAHDDGLRSVRAESFVPALWRTHAPLAESWPHLADFLLRSVAGEPADNLQELTPFRVVDGASVAPPAGH